MDGVATFTTSALSVGSHTLSAVYGGDFNYAGSTSTDLVQKVGLATMTVARDIVEKIRVSAAPVTFTAVVSVTSPGVGVPSGDMTFRDGASTLGTVTLANGEATFTTSLLTVGAHTLKAVYAGDGSFKTSTSAALTQSVPRDPTTVDITGPTATLLPGQQLQLTVVVSGGPGPVAALGEGGPDGAAPGDAPTVVAAPTGTVTFKEGRRCSAPLHLPTARRRSSTRR